MNEKTIDFNKGQRSQDGGPPLPPGEGGRARLFEYILGTVYLYIRYRKPITWNSSASPPRCTFNFSLPSKNFYGVPKSIRGRSTFWPQGPVVPETRVCPKN